MQLLLDLYDRSLPDTLSDVAEVHGARSLQAASLIEADFTTPLPGQPGREEARVTRLTPLGRKEALALMKLRGSRRAHALQRR